jgi:hypothetical protein
MALHLWGLGLGGGYSRMRCVKCDGFGLDESTSCAWDCDSELEVLGDGHFLDVFVDGDQGFGWGARPGVGVSSVLGEDLKDSSV